MWIGFRVETSSWCPHIGRTFIRRKGYCPILFPQANALAGLTMLKPRWCIWAMIWKCRWCDEVVSGLKLFLSNNTHLLINVFPFGMVFLDFIRWAQQSCHRLKQFVKFVVWNLSNISCDLPWIMVMSLSWLRHYTTGRKVVGLIPDGVIRIFHWRNPSCRTMALGLTQPLTEMITRNISWGVKVAGF